MRILTVGDNCVDWYVDENRICPGGNAVNVAVFAQRLGVDTAYIGQLGDDAGGDLIFNALSAEGVDVSHVRRSPGNTAYATIGIVDGDRIFRGSSSGVVAMQLNEADIEFATNASVIHTGAHSFMEGSLPLLSRAAPVSFDFTTRPFHYCEPLLKHVTFASFSRANFSREEVKALIDTAHSHGVRDVYVTQGEDGSWSSDGETVHFQPATPVPIVVDTMGAGDTYIAAMLKARLSGLSIAESAEIASRVAAATCTRSGAIGYCGASDHMKEALDYKTV